MKWENWRRVLKMGLVGVFVACLLVTAPVGVNPPHAMDEWLVNAELEAQESAMALYRKALEEETLIVYSNSTRVFDAKRSFEAQYPGLTVEIADMRSNDIVKLLKANSAAQSYLCDVVITSDNDASLSRELVPNGIVFPYVPWDMGDKIRPDHQQEVLMFMGEMQMLFFNTEVHATSPVSNWWELTQEKYRGKIMMPHPEKSFSTLALLMMLYRHHEEMAEAYRAWSGVDLIVPEGRTAGDFFAERLLRNVVLTNSSDEVVEQVGAPGQVDPPLGIMISSKVRMQGLGYRIAPVYDMTPYAGLYGPNCIMMAGGARNVHAAKLFIRWILGETDGTGEGAKPFLTDGTWSARIDVATGAQRPLSSLTYLSLDKTFVYEQREAFLGTMARLIEENSVKESQ